jgi:hypothetical protein
MVKAQMRRESWHATAERLKCAGWAVHWHRGWIAEARREGHFERGVGRTLDEAFAEVQQMAQLDQVEGCP